MERISATSAGLFANAAGNIESARGKALSKMRDARFSLLRAYAPAVSREAGRLSEKDAEYSEEEYALFLEYGLVHALETVSFSEDGAYFESVKKAVTEFLSFVTDGGARFFRNKASAEAMEDAVRSAEAECRKLGTPAGPGLVGALADLSEAEVTMVLWKRERTYKEINGLVMLGSGPMPGKRKERKEWNDARSALVSRFYRMIRSISNGYRNTDLSCGPEDLFQVGVCGFLRSLSKFSYEKGRDFTSYVTRGIRDEINKYIADNSRTVRLPKYKHERLGRIHRAEEELFKRGMKAGSADIAALVDMDKKTVEMDLFDESCTNTCRLDERLGDGEEEDRTRLEEISDGTPDFADELYRIALISRVREVLGRCDGIDREVVERRFGFHGDAMGDREIALELGLTLRQVRYHLEKVSALIKEEICYPA